MIETDFIDNAIHIPTTSNERRALALKCRRSAGGENSRDHMAGDTVCTNISCWCPAASCGHFVGVAKYRGQRLFELFQSHITAPYALRRSWKEDNVAAGDNPRHAALCSQ
jgi:hypothetical protein